MKAKKRKAKREDELELLAGRLLETVKAMRQIFTGISGMCVMHFAGPDEPWCGNGKHSCYCPVDAAEKALKLTAWVEVE